MNSFVCTFVQLADVARIVLDRCVTTQILTDECSQKPVIKKIYNYELIDDIYSSWGNKFEQNNSATTPRTRHKNKQMDIYNGFDEDGKLRADAKLYTSNMDELKENHPLMIMVSNLIHFFVFVIFLIKNYRFLKNVKSYSVTI